MKTWNQISKKLEKKLSQDEFNTWIRPLQGEFKEDSLEISAPNDFVLNYVSNNLKNHISDVLASQNTKIIFKDRNNSTFVDKYVEKPSSKRKNNPGLVESFVFDKFVEGKSNHLALAASKQVAQNPTGDYNPLFIYGGVGLGKTHLMHAVGNSIAERHPSLKVAYMYSQRFMEDMVRAIERGKMADFTQYYRTVNVLLMDDIQFLAKGMKTQEEFFHVFNRLQEDGSQIVLTCDRYPKEIEGLEERLESRFVWGMTAPVEPPELETRVAILMKKAELEGVLLPSDTAFFLGERIRSNVRELEGALKRVIANAKFTGREINIEQARDALRDLIAIQDRQVSIENIQKTVADYYKVRVGELNSKRRTRSIARPRQLAMAISKEITTHSLPEIGDSFGGRDHTTVLHACRKIEELRECNNDIREDYNNLLRMLTS